MAEKDRPKEIWGDEFEDGSRQACNAALADCIAGKNGACDLFFRRLGKRLREKVTNHLIRGLGVAEDEARILVVEKLEDLALLAKQGKLEIEKSYTWYLIAACQNALRDRGRLKKGHELLESQLGKDDKASLRKLEEKAALCFLRSVRAGPLRNPALIADRRDLMRRIGQQVGNLPDGYRDVITGTREGWNYQEIAKRSGRAYSTVNNEWHKGIDALCLLIMRDGFFQTPPRPLDEFIYPIRRSPSRTRVLELIRCQEVQIAKPLEMVHFEGKSVQDVQKHLFEGRAAVEALLLTGYRIVRCLTGCRFPHELLHRLPGHPHYRLHEIPFEYW